MLEKYSKNTQQIILLLIAIILNSLTPMTIKMGLKEIPPLLFLGSRFLIVGLCLLPFVRIKKGNISKTIIYGILSTISYCTIFYSFKMMAPGIVNIIIAVPVSILIASIWFKEKLSFKEAFGIMLAFIGLIMITTDVKLNNFYYIILPLIALLAGGFNTNLVKKWKKLDVKEFMLGECLTIGISCLILSFIFENNHKEIISNISIIGASCFLWTVIFGSFIMRYILLSSIEKLEIHIVQPITMVGPPLILIWDYFVFGLTLTTSQIIGAAIIMLGIFLSEYHPKKHLRKRFLVLYKRTNRH